MQIIHHGGHEGVTGSCHELRFETGTSLLVDCGLFQGDDARRHPKLEIEFALEGVAAMLLTHVHIDHVGRLPYLLAAGFTGPIYCSQPTAKLLPLVIEDALKIGFTRNERLIDAFQDRVAGMLTPLNYGTWHDVEGNARVRLRPAGHILGSACIEIDADGKRAVFSGDLGAPNAPLLKPVVPPEYADVLVLESTYGDTIHSGRENRQQSLESVLRRTLDDRGVTIIPAFSLGRTQELLYEMNGIFERIQESTGRSLLKSVDVIVDSPLANHFTEIYESLTPYWDAEAQALLATEDQPLVFENLYVIDDHEEHRSTVDYLLKSHVPAIVIAASGMCTGGRVVNYLKSFLPRENTDVVFVGYQGAGTPGRAIQGRRKEVEFDGKRVPIRATVQTLSGYSAHADQQNLVDFVAAMESPPREIALVHGETDARAALAERLREVVPQAEIRA